MFRFKCRTKDGTLFTLQVDSKTKTIKNAYAERQKELERLRIEEEARLKAEQEEADRIAAKEAAAALKVIQDQYWGLCFRAFKKRLKFFEQVEILSTLPLEPEIVEETFTYTLIFDAYSPSKRLLHFKMLCEISGLEDFSIDVKPRRKP